jgi:hypothetical protein
MPQGILLKSIKFVPKINDIKFSENDELLIVIGTLLTIIKFERNVATTIASEPIKLLERNEGKVLTCIDWINDQYLCIGDEIGCLNLYKITFSGFLLNNFQRRR